MAHRRQSIKNGSIGISKDKMKRKDGLKWGSKRVGDKRREQERIRRRKQGKRGSKDNGEKSRPKSWKIEDGS